MVAEDKRLFYVEFTDFHWEQVDDWIQTNIIEHLLYLNRDYMCTELKLGTAPWTHYSERLTGERSFVTERIRQWLDQFDHIEMWGDCLAYDWVLFCQLFGGGVECLPRNVYYIPFDICTLFKVQGVDPDISRIEYAGVKAVKHNALDDARIIKACYERLMS
jgi:hypothetical protein